MKATDAVLLQLEGPPPGHRTALARAGAAWSRSSPSPDASTTASPRDMRGEPTGAIPRPESMLPESCAVCGVLFRRFSGPEGRLEGPTMQATKGASVSLGAVVAAALASCHIVQAAVLGLLGALGM